MFSYTEENYIKAIFTLGSSNTSKEKISTGSLAKHLKTKDSSVTDMLKKLADKKLVTYKKYYGVSLTKKGKRLALKVIRKHRLWEVFLVEKLQFKWDEVHEVAEQLEHVISPKLIDSLDQFLGFPKKDPHGDPIPDPEGNIEFEPQNLMSTLKKGDFGVVNRFKSDGEGLLRYFDSLGLRLGDEIKVKDKMEFDDSVLIELNNKILSLSKQATENIYVTIK
ncbi:MAG: metal-dependent transcriptional regulator [Flavobacteriales bacterium]|nr:metal-dependent transcriptional regulator [Flavobacteriales bacterium]